MAKSLVVSFKLIIDMESLDIYKRCLESVTEIAVLFNYYEKHQCCISVNCFNNDVNEVLAVMSNTHGVMMAQVNINRSMNRLASTATEGAPILSVVDGTISPDQIIKELTLHKTSIITMLEAVTNQRKSNFIYRFETCLNDARHLVNRMQLMIKRSQQIFQPYLRASA